MDFSRIKASFGKVFNKENGDKVKTFFKKNRRYFAAAGVFAVMIFVLVSCTDGTSSDKDPMAGVYQSFEEDANTELNTLIANYYTAYAAGDTDTLKTIATPVSDAETNYIQFFSAYVDEYQNLKVYTKRGLDKNSYLVSVYLEIKFKDIETTAPGLDFFYVSTNEDGKLYINNLYSSFNQANGENEMDADVTALIAAYEQQEDILALQADVQQKCNKAMLKDENLNTFVNVTLQDAIAKWAQDYKAAVEAAKAQAEADAAAAAQAAADAEAAAQAQAAADAAAAQEEANKTTVYTTDKVNVRDSAAETGNLLGTIDAGTAVTRYADTDGWSKIDFNGTKAYVKSDFLSATQPTADAAATTDTSSYAQGQTITLTNTVNIRSSMSESASKVAVAYVNEQVTVQMSYAEGWTKVTYGNKEGYVKTEYLK